MAESPHEPPPPGRDPVLHVALRLFAGVGYDATTGRMIADAAGVDQEEIKARGGKPGIYEQIIADFFAAQNALFDEVAATFTADADGARKFLARVLDFYLDHPEAMALWQHRALDDAADLVGLDDRYRTPILRRTAEIMGAEALRHPDFLMIGNVVTWSLYGFLNGGIDRADGVHLEPGDPEARLIFRAQMHRLQDLVLGALYDEGPEPS
ncbi:helix-turn-helix domain-containing protein [Actinocorallia sp. A-T 12471]|uniref:TetR/AcrR family transcriptional regulator n=1 Tax=Actinocorallia sp. A-T 12471 TaxID=3089813 RepID=UPI0029D17D82|nr:helix-turn-helix domain-containing protein [Actinocorallia sp. A-T 12471]MDX6739183.1 helix-turn-helix domain-containing protein [Actinocorallia sp. A-T 12471]